MILNLGCGTNPFAGCINIDLIGLPHVDVVANASDLLSHDQCRLWVGQVETIYAYHLFEHFSHSEALQAISQWRQLLKKGGRLVLEMPDIERLARLIVSGATDDMTMAYIFGSQDRDGQNHHWGWSPKSLTPVLLKEGFAVEITPPQDYHAKERPCFRVEATKR